VPFILARAAFFINGRVAYLGEYRCVTIEVCSSGVVEMVAAVRAEATAEEVKVWRRWGG
jgi:hypothetical protein